MFIEIPYKSGDTVSLKLISGEEVVGRIGDPNDAANGTIILTKPMTFIMGPQGLGMVPYMFSAPQDAKIKIKESAIVAILKTDDQVNKQYIAQTTGLSLVS
jgi:hypothetical protein